MHGTEDSLVGGAGDPFAQIVPNATGSPPGAAAAPVEGTPDGTASAPPTYVTKAQYDSQQAEIERLKPLENLRWVGEALADPATRSRVVGLLTAGAAPQASPIPVADPTDAIVAKYQPQMDAAIAAGDFAAYGRATAMMGAEIGRAQSAIDLQAAAAPVLNQTGSTAIEGFFASKRNDPRTSRIFPKLEGKLRELVGQTSPQQIAAMVQNGTLMSSLEGAFKVILADSYMDGLSAAESAGKLGAAPSASPPPYGGGTRGGSPPTLPNQPQEDDADEKDDVAFLAELRKRGLDVKFTGNRNGSAIIAEMQ